MSKEFKAYKECGYKAAKCCSNCKRFATLTVNNFLEFTCKQDERLFMAINPYGECDRYEEDPTKNVLPGKSTLDVEIDFTDLDKGELDRKIMMSPQQTVKDFVGTAEIEPQNRCTNREIGLCGRT